jgi:hypothetical protein
MRSLTCLLFFLLLPFFSHSQELARFTLQTGNSERMDAPVCIPLNGIHYNTDKGTLALFEITANGEKEIACQPETGHSANLWFLLPGITQKSETRKYVVRMKPNEEPAGEKNIITLHKEAQDLTLYSHENPVLRYRFGIQYPPSGVDSLFKRSGFIHPLWSPGGEILSRIQPPDHYHHYGIWGPWTLTHIGDRKVDFWNLGEGEGTVQFSSFLSEYEGSVYSGFQALQQHIDFGGKGEDQVALNELLDVRVWNIQQKENRWMIDYTTTLNSPLPGGIMLDAYRYGGGIGFRATGKWEKDNCTVFTSEGKTRIDADGSFARWCIVEGVSDTEEGRSGILFLSHPSNRMHPEPMRLWPLDANGGRGDLYFEFVPIRHKEWKLKTRKNYTLKYRMIVFDGKMDTETAELYWNSFAFQPVLGFK